VTTTFKQQPSLKLTLPESTQSQKSGAEEHPPLVVNVDEQGLLRFGDNKMPLTLDQLRAQLLTAVAKDAGVKLAIRADKNAPWGKIVSLMDLAKEANVKTLSAFTKDAAKP